jgi:hypothetical protein
MMVPGGTLKLSRVEPMPSYMVKKFIPSADPSIVTTAGVQAGGIMMPTTASTAERSRVLDIPVTPPNHNGSTVGFIA